MKYLITGATGFIGPYLVKRLIGMGHECRCLIRNPQKAVELEKLHGVELIQGDITLPESLTGITEGIDVLFHLATLGHMSNFTVTEEMFEAVNVQGTMNIMTEALKTKVGKIVHCSSTAAMGICKDVPATEESSCHPHHAYGRSKLKAEARLLKLIAEASLPVVILRFSMVYGPGNLQDMLKLTKFAKMGIFPKIGYRQKLTPLIHVKDAVDALLLASEKAIPGEKYLITNEKSIPFDELRRLILKGLEIRRFPLYIPEQPALILADLIEKTFVMFGKSPPVARKNIESTLADRVFSIEKAKRELGFCPSIDPETGIIETVQWYTRHGWI